MNREPLTLRAAYERFKKSRTDKTRTVECYRCALDHWERLTEDPDVGEIDEQALFVFQQALLDSDPPERKRSNQSRAKADTLAPSTVNKHLRHLTAILNRLAPRAFKNPEGRGIIPVAPFVSPLPEDLDDLRTASIEEVCRIYEAADGAEWPSQLVTYCRPGDWWRGLVVVLWNLGLRRGDFMSLTWSEINLGNGTIKRKSEKTRKRKPKPLHPAVIAHLKAIHPSPTKPTRELVFGVPDWRRQLYKWWYQIQADAGIAERYTFQQIRQTCGSALYEKSPAAAQLMLDHSSIALTMKYYANSNPMLSRAVENLEQPPAFNGDDPDEPNILRFPNLG